MFGSSQEIPPFWFVTIWIPPCVKITFWQRAIHIIVCLGWPCGWGLGSGLAEFISNSQKFSHVPAGHFRKIDFRNYSSVPTSPVLIHPYMLVLGQKCPYFCDFGIFPIRILMFWLWWHPIWVVAQIQMQEMLFMAVKNSKASHPPLLPPQML